MEKNLGYKIRKLRELKGYKQEYMAKELGIDKSTYGDIEAGISKLTVERFKKIADILGYSPKTIEEFDDSYTGINNNNNQQGGNAGYVTIHNSFEELMKFYDKLVEPFKQQLVEKDKQIASKDEEIQHLRSLLKQQG